ncbi:MAG: Lar family restriction alleviation protein [Mesorhizobium sp.]
MAQELKPCPFCGTDSIDAIQYACHDKTGRWSVDCLRCGTEGPSTLAGMATAAKLWNTRPSDKLIARAIPIIETERQCLADSHSVGGELRIDPDDEGDQQARASIEAMDAWLEAARKAVAS